MTAEPKGTEKKKKRCKKHWPQGKVSGNQGVLVSEIDDIRNQQIDSQRRFQTPKFTVHPGQRPHTCPNCKGEGTREGVPRYLNPTAISCHSCSGTGIVWANPV